MTLHGLERPAPGSASSIARALRELGVERGMCLLVHSSLRSLGWVVGGSTAVIEALHRVVGDEGTIVMPTHSADMSDPATWTNPPLPAGWVQIAQSEMPAYDPRTTPSFFMGRIVETFRTWPGVIRSDHPVHSFAARGRLAREIVSEHGLENGMGERSPLARLYDADAYVLMLGVGFDSFSSFHLAEYRSGRRSLVRLRAPVLVEGERQWVAYDDIEYRDQAFEDIGAELVNAGEVASGMVECALSHLVRQRLAVDLAARWFRSEKVQA